MIDNTTIVNKLNSLIGIFKTVTEENLDLDLYIKRSTEVKKYLRHSNFIYVFNYRAPGCSWGELIDDFHMDSVIEHMYQSELYNNLKDVITVYDAQGIRCTKGNLYIYDIVDTYCRSQVKYNPNIKYLTETLDNLSIPYINKRYYIKVDITKDKFRQICESYYNKTYSEIPLMYFAEDSAYECIVNKTPITSKKCSKYSYNILEY